MEGLVHPVWPIVQSISSSVELVPRKTYRDSQASDEIGWACIAPATATGLTVDATMTQNWEEKFRTWAQSPSQTETERAEKCRKDGPQCNQR